MNQISGTTPADTQVEPQDESRPADAGTTTERSDIGQPGFGARGRMRRRARFLRKARELAYRDLGGLVFNLHRFGQRNDTLVMAKLTTIGNIDAELRTLEGALQAAQPVTVLREAGITACARCAAIHSSEDRFCPNCGLSMEPHVDLPIAGAASSPAPAPVSPQPVQQASPATPAAPYPQGPPAAGAPGPAHAAQPSSPPPETPSRPAEATREWDAGAGAPDQGAAADGEPTVQPGAPQEGQTSEAASGDDEPTEILRPPAAGT